MDKDVFKKVDGLSRFIKKKCYKTERWAETMNGRVKEITYNFPESFFEKKFARLRMILQIIKWF